MSRHHNTNDQALAKSEPNPFRMMQEMLRWDPFRAATLPTFFGNTSNAFTPAFEVKETKDSFLLKADLPGMKESDLNVQITGNRLAITGKREAEHEDETDTFYAYERSYGAFQRAFVLPDGIDADHVHAKLEDGVLTIALPKKANAQTKQIAVKSEKSKS